MGLYPAIPESEIGTKSDTLFTTKPMIRVSRTDNRGHFVIKGALPQALSGVCLARC